MTEPQPHPTPTGCDQCGQTDDHPKWHYGTETFHHDCAPARVLANADPAALKIRAAAEKGTRGDKLRALITKES